MRFIILAHERSGMHMLATALSQHPIVSVRANPHNGSRVLELFNLTNFGRREEHDSSERVLRLDRMGWFLGGHPAFCLHYNQLYHWGLQEILPAFKTKYIILRREDKLARYVSELRAMRHNQWQCYDAAEVDKCDFAVEVNCDEFLADVARKTKMENEFIETIAVEDRIFVSYESMCIDFGKCLNTICSFVGIDVLPEMIPQTVRTSKRPLSELISNYSQVEEALNN